MARIKFVTLPKKSVSKRKKTAAQKAKTKKVEIPIGPKLRLEPRLSPPIAAKKSKDTVSETESATPRKTSSDSSSVHVAFKLPDQIKFESDSNDGSRTIRFTSDPENQYKTVRQKKDFLKSSAESAVSTSSAKVPTRVVYKPRLKKGPRFKVRHCLHWSDKELLDLTTGLQKYGFKETEKIAELVKTKNVNEVENLIKLRTVDARAEHSAENLESPENQAAVENESDSGMNKTGKAKKSKDAKYRGRPRNRFTTTDPAILHFWPNIRKWRRLSYEQMLSHVRSRDYSKTVMVSLMEKFYEEEPEPSDPQIINVKAIYRYLLDCLSDTVPAQLPPKESALMMDLLRDLRLLPLVYDFDEETKFLENYKEATAYKPFQLKDEFKKRIVKTENTENVTDGFSPNSVFVPEEIFLKLSRHKRVVQSFNPLMIPVWMMQKEQEYIEQFA